MRRGESLDVIGRGRHLLVGSQPIDAVARDLIARRIRIEDDDDRNEPR